jgi:hypothetical protein
MFQMCDTTGYLAGLLQEQQQQQLQLQLHIFFYSSIVAINAPSFAGVS